MGSQDLRERGGTSLDLYFWKIAGSLSLGTRVKSRKTIYRATAVSERRWKLEQSNGGGNQNKWMNFRCILQVEPTGRLINIKFN